MGQLGQRVLLIDANMLSPNQHHLFKLPNELGLSNVIKDTSIRFPEVKMIINQVMKNLDVLTSGTKPDNSLSLLSSERMTLLLQYFAWNYDVVIIDTSPLLDINGASAINSVVDGVLLVIDPIVTQAEQIINMVKEIITRSDQKVIGMVVNNGTIAEFPNSNELDSRKTSEFKQKILYPSERDP